MQATIESTEKKIWVEKRDPETGKKKKVLIKIQTVYIVVNFGETVVRFHVYRHKSNNYDVRFTDSRDKELGNRGARSRGYNLQEMIDQLNRWSINPQIIGEAIETLDGKKVA